MASYQESTYIARIVEHAFISELTGEMIQNRNRKIDVLETLMGDSFGYDYVMVDLAKPNQPLYVQVKTCSGKAPSWPIKPLLMSNPLMEILVIFYKFVNGKPQLVYRVFDKQHRTAYLQSYNPNTPVKNFRVPRKELLPKMDIVALCNHWF